MIRIRICRDRERRRWIAFVGDRFHGEYLDKEAAFFDAIEIAQETHEAGDEVQVWDESVSPALILLTQRRLADKK